jgi:CubicO group peptidase (beta-lactamase class C family)
MRFICTLCLVGLLILSCTSHSAKEAKVSFQKDSLFSVADEYLNKLTALKQFNGVVLLKKEGEIVLHRSYNMSKETDAKLYVNKESQFDIRSIAKLFAKVSVIELEQAGRLNRTDLVQKFLPNFPNGEVITIEHLMRNQSGLPRELSNVENSLVLSPEEVIALAAKESLEFAPGSEERYSNVGFQLLYYILGKASGGTFSKYLDQTVFQPLQMTGSGDNFDENFTDWTHYAYGHFLDEDNQLQSVDGFPKDDMQMGNFHSTAEDLSKFLDVLHADKYASLRHENTISHAGGTQGKRGYVERNFKEDYSIVFLANYDVIPFQKLVEDLQKILKGEPVAMPKEVNRTAIEVSEDILQRYQGTYDFVDAGHLIMTLKLEEGILYVYQKGINNGPIYPETETIFFGDQTSEESMEFVKNDSGTYDVLMDFKGVRWKGVRIQN